MEPKPRTKNISLELTNVEMDIIDISLEYVDYVPIINRLRDKGYKIEEQEVIDALDSIMNKIAEALF